MNLRESLESIELEFLNKHVKAKVLKSLKDVRGLDEPIEASEPGSEVALRRWVALKLAEEGFIAFKEGEEMTLDELVDVHWKESLQPSSRLSSLPEDFYQRLRLYLKKVAGKGDRQRLEKSVRLAKDIVNARTRKIVSMAVSLAVPQELLQSLAPEERLLYDEVRGLVEYWRSYVFQPLEEAG